jgi:hypothetical protein
MVERQVALFRQTREQLSSLVGIGEVRSVDLNVAAAQLVVASRLDELSDILANR